MVKVITEKNAGRIISPADSTHVVSFIGSNDSVTANVLKKEMTIEFVVSIELNSKFAN